MVREFIVIQDVNAAKRGLILYEYKGDTYGQVTSTDDVAMCFNENGTGPFITVPKSALEENVY